MQEHINSISNTHYSDLLFTNGESIDQISREDTKSYLQSIKRTNPDKAFKNIMIINFSDHEAELIKQSLKHLDFFNFVLDFKVSGFTSFLNHDPIISPNAAIIFIKGSLLNSRVKETVSYIRDELKNDLIRIILMNDKIIDEEDINLLINYNINNCISESDLSEQNLKVIAASALRSYQTKKENLEYNSNLNKIIRKKTKDLLKKNEELLKADVTKNKMFSIIAHDLVNPFNSILGFSKMLKDQISDFNKEKIVLFADQIYETSQNTYKLLANLLEWSRAQTGKIKYSPRKVSVNSLIQNNIKLHGIQAKKKGLYLKFSENNNFDVFCDPNMINTVIRNLISNGIKFTEKGGVTVSTEIENNFCSIYFSDTGYGIQKNRIKNLFSFENLSTKGTAGERGSGLGLLLCNEFATKNKGSISVKSKVNSGSTFCLKIPLFSS